MLALPLFLAGCSSEADEAEKPIDTTTPAAMTTTATLDPFFDLPTTFEGFESAEQKLGWRPLRPKSGFVLDEVFGSVSAGLTGPYIVLYYVDDQSQSKLTFLQGFDSQLPGDQFRDAELPEDAVEMVGRFSSRVWYAVGEQDTAVFIFQTGVKQGDAPLFATLLAQDIDDGRSFIESLE
jgi:hypothetical protein